MPKYFLISVLIVFLCFCDVCGQSLFSGGFTDANERPQSGGPLQHPDTGLALPLPKENFDALLSAASEYMNEGKLTEEEYDRFCTDLTECTPKDPFHRPLKPLSGSASGGIPPFETVDFGGNTVVSTELFAAKKLTMLNIWDTTCLACITEMPQLKELSKEIEQKGGQVVGLAFNAVDSDMISEAKDIAVDLELNYQNLLPTDEIRSLFFSQSFPVSYFIDGQGRIIGTPIYGAQIHKYRSTMETLLNN